MLAHLRRFTVPIWLVVGLIVLYVVAWLGAGPFFVGWLAWTMDGSKPWTLLTYPFATSGVGHQALYLLFSCAWLAMIGRDLEPKLPGWKFLAAFLAYGLLGGLFGGVFGSLPLAGPWLSVAALTCLWAGWRPTSPISFWFLPMQARWLAVITAAITMFEYGTGRPLSGLLAIVPCGVAWLHGSRFFAGRPAPNGERGQKARSDAEFQSFISDVRAREKDRDERERLRKLLEGGTGDGTSGPPDSKEH